MSETMNTIIRDVAISVGMDAGETAFDMDIQTYIGIATLDLVNLGVIQTQTVMTNTAWVELGYTNPNPKEDLLPYISLVVKLHFDPPQPSMVRVYQETINRLGEGLKVEAQLRKNKEVKQ